MKTMIKKSLLWFFVILGGISCSTDQDVLSPGYETGMLINSGTSYGMCIGYCIRSLDISGTDAVYHMMSYNPDNYPYKKTTGEITLNEWNDVVSEVDEEVFKSMKNVYGCPDCADGGAEWVKITTNDYSKKVTFEVHDVPDSIKNLVNKLRVIREKFDSYAGE